MNQPTANRNVQNALPESSTDLQECIRICMDGYRVCTETMLHCLSMGGKHADADHIRTMMNCAQICLTSAQLMMTGSQQHMEVCGLCATACDNCAKSCATIGEGDPKMEECVEVCKRCAESCREMSH